MPKSFMRQVIDAFMPKGTIWRPSQGGDFDRFLDGVANNKQATLDDLKNLAHVRNPYRCPLGMLPDLEREFGILPNISLAEKARRSYLATIRYRKKTLATTQKLQNVLDGAGFGFNGHGLLVTHNAPHAINPFLVMNSSWALAANNFPSIHCAGNSLIAFCSEMKTGYYLVSGDCHQADDAAKINELSKSYWPLVFFIGGAVTRDLSGRITNIATVTMPAVYRQELNRLVLRIKPLGIWAAILVRYV